MPVHSGRHFRCTSRRGDDRPVPRPHAPDVVRHETLMAGQRREPPRPTTRGARRARGGKPYAPFCWSATTTDVDVTAGQAQQGVVACQTGRHESRHDVSNTRSSGRRLGAQRARPDVQPPVRRHGRDYVGDLVSGAWTGEIPLRMSTLRPVADRLLPDDVPVPESVSRLLSARSSTGSVAKEVVGKASQRDRERKPATKAERHPN
jgi:hypothetical protein